MSERVQVTIDNGVADVRLNRPEKLNALDRPMFEALAEAGRRLAADRSVRAVVLSGEGRAFCAGLDFASFMAMAGERSDPGEALLERGHADSPANFAQQAAWVWTEVPVPVIAAIHGVAFGGGLQIALGADLRFSTPDAQLSVMEIKWGLIPDMSGTQTLRHLLRLDIAKELTFTGRIVEGREAATLGLVTRLSDRPHAAALTMAREIAEKSPDAIRAGKRLLNQAPLLSVADGLALEARLQRGLIGSANQLEAVAANLQKRAPKFSDPA
jgi:enoyl-CoA hydratase/carnithine racemase